MTRAHSWIQIWGEEAASELFVGRYYSIYKRVHILYIIMFPISALVARKSGDWCIGVCEDTGATGVMMCRCQGDN